MAANETSGPDEIDKIFDTDPNAHVIPPEEGSPEVWLLTGDDLKVAKDALSRPADEKSATP